ncbi:MAG: PIN domain-containing protein [Candidatus Diapherotrites archaeon]
MSEQLFFFDTYAFFELIRGNPLYKRFEGASAITTIFNLAELNYSLKKEKGKSLADKITKLYELLLVDVTLQDVLEAMDLKVKNKRLSIPDAIGYIVAKRNNAKFLTGDKEFENMPNVEFVK